MNGWDALVVSVFLLAGLVFCLAAIFFDEIVDWIRAHTTKDEEARR